FNSCFCRFPEDTISLTRLKEKANVVGIGWGFVPFNCLGKALSLWVGCEQRPRKFPSRGFNLSCRCKSYGKMLTFFSFKHSKWDIKPNKVFSVGRFFPFPTKGDVSIS